VHPTPLPQGKCCHSLITEITVSSPQPFIIANTQTPFIAAKLAARVVIHVFAIQNHNKLQCKKSLTSSPEQRGVTVSAFYTKGRSQDAAFLLENRNRKFLHRQEIIYQCNYSVIKASQQ